MEKFWLLVPIDDGYPGYADHEEHQDEHPAHHQQLSLRGLVPEPFQGGGKGSAISHYICNGYFFFQNKYLIEVFIHLQ